jgi:hypothetical protein
MVNYLHLNKGRIRWCVIFNTETGDVVSNRVLAEYVKGLGFDPQNGRKNILKAHMTQILNFLDTI